jgi:hypothetical protein
MTMDFPFITRRRFLIQILSLAGMVGVSSTALAQTPGMSRRMDRRTDRTDRVNQRGENMVERVDDPLGVRGVNRREDRRDVRQDRQTDRYDRIY